MNFRIVVFQVLGCFFMSTVSAQVSKNQTLMLNVKPQESGFDVIWAENLSRTGNYALYYRDLDLKGSTFQSYGSAVKGPANKIPYVGPLKHIEFLVQYFNPNNQLESLGYISASKEYKPNFQKGRVILLIDSIIHDQLSLEIDSLKHDFLANGWFNYSIVVSNRLSAETIKDSLYRYLKSNPSTRNALYILGHVPVPYSGYFSSTGTRPPPDGHVEGSGNHTGAWPADVYYGDFEGIWEDILVNCTTGSETRLHNIAGDGKFDPSVIPGEVSLDIGRVDFSNLPVFSQSEIQLTRAYLNRVHRWKMGEIPFVKRGLIDDNFGNLNLASTGYHNLSCFIELDSIFDNRDYFTSQRNDNYWWSYGCGAGSYTSCSGVGTSSDFANLRSKDSFNNIFTILAGSYFGDWDSRNNLLRSSLAAGSLATFWGGIPKWYIHHMANGKHIGYGARITQNNSNEYFNGNFNSSFKGVHIALLGDPTLELMPVKPVSNVKALSQNGVVNLSWNASTDADEYEIYIIDLDSMKYIPINTQGTCMKKVTEPFFTDECNWKTGRYTYGVLAVKLESNASGTFWNRSLLTLTTVDHLNNQKNLLSSQSINIGYPNPTDGLFFIENSKLNGSSFHWELIQIDGKCVTKGQNGITENILNFQGVPSGIYILKLIDGQQHTFQELINITK